MEDYLSKKYHIYSKNTAQKPFNSHHIQEELLCSPNIAKLHIKEALQKQYESFNFDNFVKIITVTLDLD